MKLSFSALVRPIDDLSSIVSKNILSISIDGLTYGSDFTWSVTNFISTSMTIQLSILNSRGVDFITVSYFCLLMYIYSNAST